MVAALFDTNILIDYLNGIDEARRELGRYQDKAISQISWMEVMVGADRETESAIRGFLNSFTRLAVDDKVSERAVELRRCHKVKLPDAIILATAQVSGRMLVTRDARDFLSAEPGVRIPYRI